MNEHILFTQKIRKYRGKYIAVVGNRIVASGRSAKEAFTLAKKLPGSRKVEGLYYVPQRRDLLTALCVFRTSS